jgi:hypothetical protein
MNNKLTWVLFGGLNDPPMDVGMGNLTARLERTATHLSRSAADKGRR